jgi:uncharacterized membrane protein
VFDFVNATVAAFLVRSQSRDLGKLSQAWLSYADHRDFGPAHEQTLRLQRAASVELDTCKTGLKANPRVLQSADQMPKPDYLFVGAAAASNEGDLPIDLRNETRNTAIADRAGLGTEHRSRILGILYSIASGGLSLVEVKAGRRDSSQSIPFGLGLELDTHLRFVPGNRDEQRQFDMLFGKWSGFFTEHNVQLARAIQTHKGNATVRNAVIQAIKLRYRQLFDVEAEAIYTLKYASMVGSLNLLNGSTLTSHGGMQTSAVRALLESCRILVAQAVYAAVYRRTKVSKYSQEFPLSFVWEVCGTELHYLKGRMVRSEQGQSSLNLLNAEIMESLFYS